MSVSGDVEILTTADSARWKALLDEIGVYDAYHLPHYHILAEMRGEGRALMPVYRCDGFVIAFPMLIRDIDVPAAEGRLLADTTSVYGLPGPVASPLPIPEHVAADYAGFLQRFLESQSVVCAFTRLNPLLDQSSILASIGAIVGIGPSIYVDLTLSPDAQRAQYRRTHRVAIARLRDEGFVCERVGEERLADFVGLYGETMDRTNADPYYRFDESYFHYLMNEMSDVTRLFMCRAGRTMVCGVLVFECNGVIQGHLTGSANAYIHHAPMKLMMDALRVWGNEIGARVLHVGGGVGGQNDSLLFFKRGFSRCEKTYSIWRHVVNAELYDELNQRMCQLAGIEPDSFYFPYYRHPALLRQRLEATT